MKTLFLLGGNGDIGKSIKDKFVSSGFRVIAPGRNELDLSDRCSVEQYFQDSKFEINALIQCAGVNSPESFAKINYGDIDKTNDVNYICLFRIVQHLLDSLKKNQGHIAVISSLYSSFAREKRLPYVMSKHALNGLVKTLALELAPYGIKTNAVSPGFVDTQMTIKNNDPSTIKKIISKIPLGRLALPRDIANLTHFLCSEGNQYINGQNIIVDGGYSAGGFQN